MFSVFEEAEATIRANCQVSKGQSDGDASSSVVTLAILEEANRC